MTWLLLVLALVMSFVAGVAVGFGLLFPMALSFVAKRDPAWFELWVDKIREVER